MRNLKGCRPFTKEKRKMGRGVGSRAPPPWDLKLYKMAGCAVRKIIFQERA